MAIIGLGTTEVIIIVVALAIILFVLVVINAFRRGLKGP
jgi:hypothetical protein